MRAETPIPTLAAVALAAVLLALLAVDQGAEATIEFEDTPTPVPGDDTGTQTSVAMAAGPEDMLYAVWEDGRFASLQQGVALLFAWSEPDQRGRAWSDEVRLPAGDQRNDASSPAISVGPDGVIHVVWQELRIVDGTSGGPHYWEVRYAFSSDNGLTWEGLRVSQPNNRNNTRPDVAALPGASAYVAWELEDHPGSSIALALVEQGSRAWFREDLAEASARWEVNAGVCLGMTSGGDLHVAWEARDMDGMWEVRTSQVLYMEAGTPARDSELEDPVPLADLSVNVTNTGPALTVTRRHGTWVAWVQQRTMVATDQGVTVMADRVEDGSPGTDVLVGTFSTVPGAVPRVDSSRAPDDGVALVIGWAGSPTLPPLFTHTCSEQGCFAEASAVVPGVSPAAVRATVAMDGLENVYVGWDDGTDVVCTQRRNTPPGPPELLRPDGATSAENAEFVWSFNDVDAGAGQTGFEIAYSLDRAFPAPDTLGGVVLGAQGRSGRYVAPDPLEEGRWYWRVRTRDDLGLWSEWSPVGDFLADRTAPRGRVVINDGDGYTSDRVVVLTLNVTDNLMDLGGEMHFQISTDPNFPNASMHEWPPPNHQVNQELPRGEGVKVVFFRVFDAAGLPHTSIDDIIYNVTPIRIYHAPITSAPGAKPLNVTAEIVGPGQVAATLFYRRSYEDEFREVEMESNGSSFWAVIPKDHMSLKGVYYYIEARSGGARATTPGTDPAEEPHEIRVYETTDVYQPPIYNPILTFAGALAVLVALALIWYYRLRE